MKKAHRLLITGLVTLAVASMALPAGARVLGPDYQALKACLQNCINTTPPWTIARAACGADCLADYADSKLSFASNGGAGSYNGTDYVLVNAPRTFLAADDLPQDPVVSIDWYLVRPGDPNPALLASGSLGTPVNLSPASFGADVDGFLVADATRQSGAEALYSVYVGNNSLEPVPAASTVALVALMVSLALAGAWMLKRRADAAV